MDGRTGHARAERRIERALHHAAGRVLIVGCEPASVDEGIGLSPEVAAAVPAAVRTVTELAWGTSPRPHTTEV